MEVKLFAFHGFSFETIFGGKMLECGHLNSRGVLSFCKFLHKRVLLELMKCVSFKRGEYNKKTLCEMSAALPTFSAAFVSNEPS